MRIKQLDLIRFGKFEDKSLDFPASSNDFHVIVGPNEAGKSTILTAIQEMLFGMPLRSNMGFEHDLRHLRIGATLESDGGQLSFHRARGRTPLRTPQDERLPDDALAPFLAGVSAEFYAQMFGLDHTRLVAGGRTILDASNDVGRVLFQSAAGVASLGPVREMLGNRATELWTSRARSTEFALAENALKDASEALKGATVRTRAWSDARSARDDAKDAHQEEQAARMRLENERSRLERVRRLAPRLQALRQLESDLAALGDVTEMPATARTNLEDAQAALSAARATWNERDAQMKTHQQERAAIEIDRAALEMADDIEALDALRGTSINHPRTLETLRVQHARHLSDAARAAKDLGWGTDETSMRSKLPGQLALKTVTQLHGERGALNQARVSACKAADEKREELTTLRHSWKAMAAVEVPTSLYDALDSAQEALALHAKLPELAKKRDEAIVALSHGLDALGRWKQPIDALRRMNIPSADRISRLRQRTQAYQTAFERARDRLREMKSEQRSLELQERQFVEAARVVTASDVHEARTQRNAAWHGIKTGEVALADGAPTVDATMARADELADGLLEDAERSAQLLNLRHQLERANSNLASQAQTLSDCQTEQTRAEEEWRALALEIDLPGMALEDLTDWLARRAEAIAADEDAQSASRAVVEDERICTAAETRLANALAQANAGKPSEDGLGSLVRHATGSIRSAETALARKENLEQQVKQAEGALKHLETSASDAKAAFEHWETQWQTALSAAGLQRVDHAPAETIIAVEMANAVAASLGAADELQNARMSSIQGDLNELKRMAHQIANVIGETAPETIDPFELANALIARLRRAQNSEKTAIRIDTAIGTAKARVDESNCDIASTYARIKPLLDRAATDKIDEAIEVAKQSDRHRSIATSIDATLGDLLRDGDGLDRRAIEQEVAHLDLDQIAGRLDKVKLDLDESAERLSDLIADEINAQQSFDAIDGQADAAIAAAKRQEALASMADIADQYVEATTANRILKWAIDRYRDRKQGPMLKRAGEIFEQLTCGRFARLIVDYEIEPPALVTRRANGKDVEVSGLSEGTQDQLYLALRIAALELHLANAHAMPFLADDLFVNFDDERARAGLAVLRDLSRKTQVVFLTHHDHLLPIITDVCGGSTNIVTLNS